MRDNKITKSETDLGAHQSNAPSLQKHGDAAQILRESMNAGEKSSKRKQVLIAVFCGLFVIILSLCLWYWIEFLKRKESIKGLNGLDPEVVASIENSSITQYSLDRDTVSRERSLFGSNDKKDNSGEAFARFQTQIIEAADSTFDEVFDATIALAVYYTAIEEYDDAYAILESLDSTKFFPDQTERFNEVLGNLESARKNVQ